MNDQVLKSLIQSLLRDCPDLSLEFKARLGYAVDDHYAAIWWSVEDFEHRATVIELEHQKGKLFDRAKFKEALDLMCYASGEDPDNGTTWATVDEYLNAMCRLEG